MRRCMLTSVWLTLSTIDHRSSGLNTLNTRYEPSVAAVPDAAAVSDERVADAKGSLSEV